MEKLFEEYSLYNLNILAVDEMFKIVPKAFDLFQELFDPTFGSIQINDNLISIHTGGWSKNEVLIQEFKTTTWWHLYYRGQMSGGHYFFDTNFDAKKEWKMVALGD